VALLVFAQNFCIPQKFIYPLFKITD